MFGRFFRPAADSRQPGFRVLLHSTRIEFLAQMVIGEVAVGNRPN